ncbi:hypothetical protein BDA96_04G213800 [Sorghum bicolor]|uniref:Uncharacterized protein n=1 Tax=Sorghum bicolor TaxID=4558 RepID=A0A921R421_SORBI|nr:hypothetical protein BDA96_04G213800 [Sorghum bicolor]
MSVRTHRNPVRFSLFSVSAGHFYLLQLKRLKRGQSFGATILRRGFVLPSCDPHPARLSLPNKKRKQNRFAPNSSSPPPPVLPNPPPCRAPRRRSSSAAQILLDAVFLGSTCLPSIPSRIHRRRRLRWPGLRPASGFLHRRLPPPLPRPRGRRRRLRRGLRRRIRPHRVLLGLPCHLRRKLRRGQCRRPRGEA